MTTATVNAAIVDDDQIVCSSLSTILTQTGTADVLWTACNGSDAIRNYFQSPSSHPDVLLLDIQMEGMSGLETASEILRRDPASRILFLTTFSDRDYITKAVTLGARGYLIKQDVASVGPALQAVMAGQIVLGAEVLDKLSHRSGDLRPSRGTGAEERAAGDASRQAQRDRAGLKRLSERERQITLLVAQGLDNAQIASALFLSEGTVRNRISTMLAKLDMTNRTQLAIAWLRSEEDEHWLRPEEDEH